MTYHVRHINPQVIGSGVKHDFYLVVDREGNVIRTFANRADAVRDCATRNGGCEVLMTAWTDTEQEATNG